MKGRVGSCLCKVAFVFGLIFVASQTAWAASSFSMELVSVSSLSATDFSFTQLGFDESAFVTGTFTGIDLDLDGQLSSFDGEILAFGMTFSGNSLVSTFSLGFLDLFGLVYDLDGGPLGDGLGGDIEGIGAFDFDNLYLAGPGPFAECGIGVDCAVVEGPGSVPEPASLLLSVVGLLGVLSLRRLKK